MLEIILKAPKLEEIKKELGALEKKAPKILARVLNRTLTNVQKNVVKSVRDKYIIKASDIKQTLKTTKASTSKLNAQVKSEGMRVLLYKFRVSPKNPRPSKAPRTYKARVLKKSALKPVRGGFVAQMKSGHLGIFERTGTKRTPIKELVGPSIPQMVGNKEIIQKIESEAQKTIQNRLKHEITRTINP